MLIATNDFLHRLSAPSMPSGRYQVDVDGVPIWFRVKRRDASAVIFTFQGTINREKTRVPIFGTDLSSSIPNATLIGISDPALDVFPAPLGSGWYAGWDGVELQDRLGEMLAQIVGALAADRVIFQGSSAGGFAALYYGSRIKDSVVVAINPQTNLDAYKYTEKYRTACWPNLTGRLGSVIDCDLVSRYATDFANHVVYIQAATDTHHVMSQMVPFLSAIEDRISRVLLYTTFFGKFGHRELPTERWVPFVKAAVDAPQADTQGIAALVGSW